MKTSVSLSVFEAPAGMPALFSQATEENLRFISEHGYDGVDLFVRDPYAEQTRQAAKDLSRYGLGVGAIMPAALAREGLFLADPNPEVQAEAIRRIGEIIPLAQETGGMVSLGLVRGNRPDGQSEEAFFDVFAQSCEALLELSEPRKVPLVIEPINRYEINNMNSVEQSVDFIRKYQMPLYLMIDTFHMNIEDRSMEEAILQAAPYTKHIHFLDSNRLAPSMGHLDMAGLYRVIESTGYTGYLCLEALPRPDSKTCAARGAEFFRSVK